MEKIDLLTKKFIEDFKELLTRLDVVEERQQKSVKLISELCGSVQKLSDTLLHGLSELRLLTSRLSAVERKIKEMEEKSNVDSDS